MSLWTERFSEAALLLKHIAEDPSFFSQCQKWSDKIVDTYNSGRNIFSCGNGGSHCDAMHFAEELTGRFKANRPPIGALALGDPSHTTCVANDFGFEQIFARQLEGLGQKGDMLVAISTSGQSENVLRAVEVAKKKGLFVVGLLGKDGGPLASQCEIPLVVPSKVTERIQEVHIKLIHTAIESAERNLFPDEYA